MPGNKQNSMATQSKTFYLFGIHRLKTKIFVSLFKMKTIDKNSLIGIDPFYYTSFLIIIDNKCTFKTKTKLIL